MIYLLMDSNNWKSPFDGLRENLEKKGQKVYKKCDKAWSYLGKIMLFTRSSLNATLQSSRFTLIPKGQECKVTGVVTHLKVFSVISIPFAIANIPATVQKIFKSFQLNDKEGAALASLTFVLIMGDMLDTVATFLNAAIALAYKTPIQFFSVIGLPLAFGLVSLGSISRTVQLVKTHQVYKKFKMKVLSNINKDSKQDEIKEVLQDFLEKKIGNELKKAKFQRALPPEVLDKLESLMKLCQEDQELDAETVHEIVKDLMEIKEKFKEKMAFDISNLFANALAFTGLCLMLTGAPAAIAFVLFAIAMAIRIALLIKQDFFQRKEIVAVVQEQRPEKQILTIDNEAFVS